jgi:ribonuclease HI
MSQINFVGYTDGGFSSIHSVGSWAYVLYSKDNGSKMIEQCGIVNNEKQTSQVAEITAIFELIKMVNTQLCLNKLVNTKKINLEIYSDSMYCVNTINDWMYRWVDKDWQVDKQNLDLWKQIHNLKSNFNSIKMHWVKGHNGDPLNERVDYLNQVALKEHIWTLQ